MIQQNHIQRYVFRLNTIIVKEMTLGHTNQSKSNATIALATIILTEKNYP